MIAQEDVAARGALHHAPVRGGAADVGPSDESGKLRDARLSGRRRDGCEVSSRTKGKEEAPRPVQGGRLSGSQQPALGAQLSAVGCWQPVRSSQDSAVSYSRHGGQFQPLQ